MFYTDVKQRAPIAEYDQALLWITLVLLGIGTVMVYSASIAIAEGSRSTGHQPGYYLMRHAFFLLMSLTK